MTSHNAPPGRSGRDPARPDASADPSKAGLPRSNAPASAGSPPAAASSQPLAQPASPDRPDASAARHRVAPGLPPQPSPLGAAKSIARPDQPIAGLARESSVSMRARPAWQKAARISPPRGRGPAVRSRPIPRLRSRLAREPRPMRRCLRGQPRVRSLPLRRLWRCHRSARRNRHRPDGWCLVSVSRNRPYRGGRMDWAGRSWSPNA